jgi:hypothetical protein
MIIAVKEGIVYNSTIVWREEYFRKSIWKCPVCYNVSGYEMTFSHIDKIMRNSHSIRIFLSLLYNFIFQWVTKPYVIN